MRETWGLSCIDKCLRIVCSSISSKKLHSPDHSSFKQHFKHTGLQQHWCMHCCRGLGEPVALHSLLSQEADRLRELAEDEFGPGC